MVRWWGFLIFTLYLLPATARSVFRSAVRGARELGSRFAALCLLPRFSLGFLVAVAAAACPVSFQTQSAASLIPTAASHTVLLRANAGPFTGYEMQNTAPFAVLNVTTAFQNQLTICPPPPAGVSPTFTVVPPQAFAQLTSGGYLFLQRSDLFGTPGDDSAIYAMDFTSALGLVSRSTLTLANSGIASALALADLNGDGLPDIIAGAGYPHSTGIQVLLGKGGTSFQSPVSYPTSEFNIQGVTLADVNGDNKLDIVIVGSGGPSQGEASVLLGNGDGTFQPEKIVVTYYDGSFSAVAVADLNGDGKPDLAITANTAGGLTTVMVALGKGDGTFSNFISSPLSYPVGGSDSLAIADVNGDGFPDIVASGISILFGDGTGAFPNRRDYVQQTAGNIILTDFNGDGKTDIVIGTGASWILGGTAVAVMYGNGDGTFSGAPITVVPGHATSDSPASAIQSADLDGDGIPDLLFSDSTNITSLHGQGNGNFTVVSQYNTEGNGAYTSAIAIGDFNRDGIPDFAAALGNFSEGSIAVFLGVGDGTFRPPLLAPLGELKAPPALFTADLNNDGKLDLVAVEGPYAVVGGPYAGPDTSTIVTCLGNGDGTFAAPVSQLTVSGSLSVVPGDFNNDGIPDLAVATVAPPPQFGGTVMVLLGVGDGTFRASPSLSLPEMEGVIITLAAGDFNLDGKLDLALALAISSGGEGQLDTLLGNGDGTFQSPVLYSATYGPGSPIVTDLNGDGIPDLVTGGGYFLGNGDGTFKPQVSIAFNAMLAADFTGDGQIDLAGFSKLGVGVMLNVSRSAAFTLVSSASFQAGPAAPESLVSAFGSGLASGTATAPSGTAPLQLAGTSVTVTDALGVSRTAPLLFVSAGQMNFQVPAGTSPGAATVTITNGAASPQTAVSSPADIASVAPALFTLNRAGLAAAYVVSVSGSTQTVEPIFTLQNGVAIPVPIDLTSPGQQVYLCLFGTGIRNAAGDTVSVRINGLNAAVSYAGPQLGTPGLDQVNILLPAVLAGAGEVGVVLTAAGHTTNAAYVFIQ